jgi:hypothetical protein
LRQVAGAKAGIQLIEEHFQAALAHLTGGHVQQDLAHFGGGALDRPADLSVTDMWIAALVELKSQCGIGRRAGNVLCLMDICQGMRISTRRRSARSASGGGCGGIAGLTRSGMRLQGKGTQPGGALSPTSKGADAFNRRTGPGI